MCQIYKKKTTKKGSYGIDRGLLKMGGNVNIAKQLINKN